MSAEAAGIYGYRGSSYYGSAAPARAPDVWPESEPEEIPAPRERARSEERAKTAVAQRAPAVSLFAVFGTLFVGVLMVLVVLAQISYNEIASETARLNSQYDSLIEQERMLKIEFENVIDIKEVERYAKDTLGMSKPDTDQVAAIKGIAFDSAEIIDSSGDYAAKGDFVSFISSLIEYFR